MYTCFRCWPIVFVSSSFGQKSAACWDVGASCAATSLSYLCEAPSPGFSTPPPEFPPFFGYPAATSTASNSCYSSCVFRSLASLSQIHSHTHRYVLANTHTHTVAARLLPVLLSRSLLLAFMAVLPTLFKVSTKMLAANQSWAPSRGFPRERGWGSMCFPDGQRKVSS